MAEFSEEFVEEIVEEISRIGYNIGLDAGNTINEALKSGSINLNQPINLLIPPGSLKINPKNFPLQARFTMLLGSTKGGMVGNSALACAGLYTGGSSALQLKSTTNPTAKMLYSCSIACSALALGTASTAVLARACQVSQTAALSEGLGIAFMKLGDKAHREALKLEGKKALVKRESLYSNTNSDIAFFIPKNTSLASIIEKIPFQTIGKGVGLTISIYLYGKLIIKAYSYGQQLITKFQKRRKRRLLKAAKALTTAFYRSPYFCKRASIYRLAVFQLDYLPIQSNLGVVI